jgi:hypothetical protein
VVQSRFILLQRRKLGAALKLRFPRREVYSSRHDLSRYHRAECLFNPVDVFFTELLHSEFKATTTGQAPFFVVFGGDAILGDVNLRAIEFAREKTSNEVFFDTAAGYAACLRAIGFKGDQ